jgi:hypothetical protein
VQLNWHGIRINFEKARKKYQFDTLHQINEAKKLYIQLLNLLSNLYIRRQLSICK